MSSWVCGIDAGSNTVKVVVLNMDGRMEYRIDKTGYNSVETAERGLKAVIKAAGLENEAINHITATGYGRNYIDFADERITEISCHAVGVHHLLPGVRTILDIGGQDSKVIYLDDDGKVLDFVMNDKCAAGTGRFIEVMAEALQLDLEEMGQEALTSTQEIFISNTCTVFAESEVITYVARGIKRPDIIAGIHRSIVNRLLSMMRRKKIRWEVCLTGGVARNIGIVRLVEQGLGAPVRIAEEPQITGALGAALLARERIR